MTGVFEFYLQEVSAKFLREETSEMGYRTNLENLLKKIFETIKVHQIDHDPKATQHNKPDFVILSHDVPIMYLEAKDIGVSLDKIEKSEQMARYYGYANLVLTDYLEFRFYRNGLPYGEPIKLANYNLKTRTINPLPENFDFLAKTLLEFTQSHKEPIKSGKHLAKIMGGKAQRIRDNIRQFFSLESGRESELNKLYKTLKELLVHDLTPESFADMYAQTLVYGLFVARFYDKTRGNFTRQEARDLIPNSNPFLRHFFDHIIGADFDIRLKYIVDELCEVFSHADVSTLMKEYFKTDLWGEVHQGKDPVIHFYEDFLKEYDDALRKKMGAYYTPPAVVNFIVRSVDSLLIKEFGLISGLADTSKTKDGVHKVQVLDPACGTGTFISSIIRLIYERLLKSGQKGRWPAYVHHDLLTRLYGFELMMTPYTIAHLKLGIAFKQTGFWDFHRRLGIYLTNSLEESGKQQEMFSFGLAESIAKESKDASVIKSEKPIMVVIGNPPYSGESSNSHYHGNDVYKVEPTGGKLKEKNPKWLNDDYVKFIRFAESMVEKNGEGIVAMITAHGYIDNPTFRGMRWHLMNIFDEIYVLDLHGNTNKKEKSPDGSEDKNIFDIKTGVAIFVGVKKKSRKSSLAKIYKSDFYGKRIAKFKFLNENIITSIKSEQLNPTGPNYDWVAVDEKLKKKYEEGFLVNELFSLSNVGIVTSRDEFIMDSNKDILITRLQDFFQSKSADEAKLKFNLRENKKWKVNTVLKHVFVNNQIIPINYHPFDTRFIYYHDEFIERSRRDVMQHLLNGGLGLTILRQVKAGETFQHILVSSGIVESTYVSNKTSEIGSVFPLYIYLKDGLKVPNLKKEILKNIENIVESFSPEDILGYIYAVLYSPSYRGKFNFFLRKGFPRVPYPKNKNTFNRLVKFGAKLCQLHLLKAPEVNQFITTYPVEGSNTVEKITFNDGNVFINKDQYFGQVPEVAWNFYIGGYQPAQKWLKDRKGRELTNEEIEHYQKMIVAINDTVKIMNEIDKVNI